MGYGRIKIKHFLVLIDWTINKDLASILGKIRKYIKDSLEMIIGKVMDRFTA